MMDQYKDQSEKQSGHTLMMSGSIDRAKSTDTFNDNRRASSTQGSGQFNNLDIAAHLNNGNRNKNKQFGTSTTSDNSRAFPITTIIER